jgi:hypothetical protein
MGNEVTTTKPVITVNAGAARSTEQWREIRDRALACLAGKGSLLHDAEFFATLALEYERSARDFNRSDKQIAELQEKLNDLQQRDRLARGVTE